MEDPCDNRIEAVAARRAEGRSGPENASESTLWRDYLTSVLNIPIIRQEIKHEIPTDA
jgi:hypothetical protein